MSHFFRTIAIVALAITASISAAHAQQNSPDSHASPMGNGGMMGMHPGGSDNQMQDMNKMMMQMSQMMDRCDAMMKDEHKMHSSDGHDDHPHGWE